MHGYFAFIHSPEAGSEWGVTFPDVTGCVSGGASFEEAVLAAREALSGHLAALRADGDPVPAPRELPEILADPVARADAEGAYAQLIFPRSVPAERVRVNIMIDKGMLRQADEAADARGLTRSALIEAALTKFVDA